MSVCVMSPLQAVCQSEVQTVICRRFYCLSCIESNVSTVGGQLFGKDLKGSDNDIIKCTLSDWATDLMKARKIFGEKW